MVLMLAISGCKDPLTDFTSNIANGYTPFNTIYVGDQIRCGFVKSGSVKFVFDEFLVGCAEKRIISNEASYTFDQKKLASLGTKVKSVVGADLSYKNINNIRVLAKNIYSYSYPTTYSYYVNADKSKEQVKKEVITAIAQAETIDMTVIYNEGFNAKADAEKLALELTNIHADVTATTDKSLTVSYKNRNIGFISENIRVEQVKALNGDEIFYGKVTLPDVNPTKVKVKFTTGSDSEQYLDVYGRFTVKVKTNNLDSFVACDARNKELSSPKKYNTSNATNEYNIP